MGQKEKKKQIGSDTSIPGGPLWMLNPRLERIRRVGRSMVDSFISSNGQDPIT